MKYWSHKFVLAQLRKISSLLNQILVWRRAFIWSNCSLSKLACPGGMYDQIFYTTTLLTLASYLFNQSTSKIFFKPSRGRSNELAFVFERQWTILTNFPLSYLLEQCFPNFFHVCKASDNKMCTKPFILRYKFHF